MSGHAGKGQTGDGDHRRVGDLTVLLFSSYPRCVWAVFIDLADAHLFP